MHFSSSYHASINFILMHPHIFFSPLIVMILKPHAAISQWVYNYYHGYMYMYVLFVSYLGYQMKPYGQALSPIQLQNCSYLFPDIAFYHAEGLYYMSSEYGLISHRHLAYCGWNDHSCISKLYTEWKALYCRCSITGCHFKTYQLTWALITIWMERLTFPG